MGIKEVTGMGMGRNPPEHAQHSDPCRNRRGVRLPQKSERHPVASAETIGITDALAQPMRFSIVYYPRLFVTLGVRAPAVLSCRYRCRIRYLRLW